jgi:hypothetical protein
VGIKAGFEIPADEGRDGSTVKPEMLTDKTLVAIDGNIAQAKSEVVRSYPCSVHITLQ